MKVIIQLIRFFVGVLFIFSGLIKANDPMGLSYKMQEFFEIWGLHFLNDYTLVLSICMIGFEIIAGIALLVGWQIRLFSWLLFLLIVFFTFLTGYAVLSGKIKECGCFGDCIKLTANQSFYKDLLLLALSSILLWKKDMIQPLFKDRVSRLILILSTVFSFGIQFYVLAYLPIIDCLPYKKGVSIPENMKIPAGAIPDSTVINFVYTKNGAEVEFDAEHFPADFNDSLYQFVKRYDKVVREGNAKPPIKDFVILSSTGADTTQAILSDPQERYILFAKTMEGDAGDWIEDFKSLIQSKGSQMPIIAVTSDADNLTTLFAKAQINIPIMKGDLVAIKTAARTNPTLYKIKAGVILDKYGKKQIAKAIE
ncbi:MAG: hypothetical protein RL131_1258 [Bacteroidota bacterium]|jgi:uncharacterized membrane protein YphA (DoxX/SURF4 family)